MTPPDLTRATGHMSLPWRLPKPGRILRELRSRHRPPPIAGAAIGAVAEQYGLGAVGPLAGLPIGWRSDNVVVATETGPVVVKRYPARAAPEAIVHEHSIALRLADGDYPVAPPRTNLQGATFCVVDGRLFSVADFVDGVSLSGCYLDPSRERGLFHDAGVLLAWFHDELAGFRPRGRHHLGLEASQRRSQEEIDGVLRSLDDLRRVDAETPIGDSERWLVDHGAAIREALLESGRQLAQRRVSVGVIHGDFGLHNLTYARDGSPTVHDLELARIDRLLIDVVVVLSRSDVRCGRAFLDGYRSVRGFGGADWEALPIVWRHYRLCGAVRSWQNFRDQGGQRRLVAARERVEEAGRIATRGVGAWE